MTTISPQDAYYQLSYYTLAHKDPEFIHQHIVDAYAAQTADESTKPIKLIFALIGLYLAVEKNYTGKQVQIIHIALGANKRVWPKIELPLNRGEITVLDVLAIKEGKERDLKIKEWCKSVWVTYKSSQQIIRDIVE
jgi:hypothetical protein